MKSNISSPLKILSWITVLCVIGCSSPEVGNSPSLTDSSAETPTASVVEIPILLSFTGKIAFLWGKIGSDDNRIYVMNANGSEITDVTPHNLRSKDNLSWSPDGQYIAFEATKDGTVQIFKMKADGSNLAQLTFGEQNASYPSWSPDGEHIIFKSSDVGIIDGGFPVPQIYMMNSDGSEVHRFIVDTRPDNASMTGSYRADGLIAISEPFTKYARTNYIVNSEGVIQEQFPEIWVSSPIVWSPDGKFVVYSADRRVPNDCLGLVLMKFDRSDRSCLVTDEAVANHVVMDSASWSPEGKYILFSAILGGDSDLYIIKADNSGLTQLTNLPGSEGGAVWWSAP